MQEYVFILFESLRRNAKQVIYNSYNYYIFEKEAIIKFSIISKKKLLVSSFKIHNLEEIECTLNISVYILHIKRKNKNILFLTNNKN